MKKIILSMGFFVLTGCVAPHKYYIEGYLDGYVMGYLNKNCHVYIQNQLDKNPEPQTAALLDHAKCEKWFPYHPDESSDFEKVLK